MNKTRKKKQQIEQNEWRKMNIFLYNSAKKANDLQIHEQDVKWSVHRFELLIFRYLFYPQRKIEFVSLNLWPILSRLGSCAIPKLEEKTKEIQKKTISPIWIYLFIKTPPDKIASKSSVEPLLTQHKMVNKCWIWKCSHKSDKMFCLKKKINKNKNYFTAIYTLLKMMRKRKKLPSVLYSFANLIR